MKNVVARVVDGGSRRVLVNTERVGSHRSRGMLVGH